MNHLSILAEMERLSASNCLESMQQYLRNLSLDQVFMFLSTYRLSEDFERNLSLSVVHRGGFEKHFISRFSSGSELRVHVWRSDEQIDEPRKNAVHNHRWDFVSKIVSGTLKETIYIFDENGPEYVEHKYLINPSTGVSSIQPIGRVNISSEGVICHCGEDVYVREYETLHVAEGCGKDHVITLCLTTPQKQEQTQVFFRGKEFNEKADRGVSDDRNLLAKKFDEVLEIIGSKI